MPACASICQHAAACPYVNVYNVPSAKVMRGGNWQLTLSNWTFSILGTLRKLLAESRESVNIIVSGYVYGYLWISGC